MAKTFSLKEHSLTGINLIEASAGTGKTYTISGIFCKLLLQKVPCSKILIVTFTNLAKGELIERLHSDSYDLYLVLIKKKRLEEAKPFFKEIIKPEHYHANIISHVLEELPNIDEHILTIHGFCNDLASRFFFEFGFGSAEQVIEDEKDIFEKTFFQILQQEIYPLFEIENQTENEKKLQKNKFLLEYIFTLQSGFQGIKEKLSHYQKDLKFELTESELKEFTPEDFEILLQQYQKLRKTIKEKLKKEQYWVHYTDAKGNYQSDFLIYFIELIKEFGNGNKFKNHEKHLTAIKKFFIEENQKFFICYCQKKKILEDSKGDRIYNKYNIDYFEKNRLKKKKQAKIKIYSSDSIKLELKLQAKFVDFLKELNSFFELSEKIEILLRQQYKKILEKSLFSLQKKIVQTKSNLSVKTHDDSLKNVLDAIKKIENDNHSHLTLIRKEYDTILVDEFQDTDKKQIQIFDKLFLQSPTAKNIFFIGDPKQSIYSFRGADLNSYLSIKKKCQVYTLNQNWRSTENLVNSVNYLFEKKKNPFLNTEIINPEIRAGKEKKDFFLEEKFGNSVEIWFNKFSLKKELGRNTFSIATVNHIISLLHLGIKKKQIGILVRKKKQAEFIIEELNKNQIAYTWADKEDLFKTTEANDFYLVLKAIIFRNKEKSIPALSSNLCQSYFKQKESFDSLEEIFEYLYLINQQQQNSTLAKKWVHWKKKIQSCYSIWQKENFVKAINFFFDEGFVANILTSKNGVQIYANLEKLIEICRQQILTKSLNQNGLIKWFEKELTNSKNSSNVDYPVEMIQQDDTIQIMTVHKSKGLEFDFVYCPFMWDYENKDKGELYLAEDGYKIPLDKKTKESNKSFSKQAEKEEDRRLTYVMLTRAKKKMILGVGNTKDNKRKEEIGNSPIESLIPEIFTFEDEQELIKKIEKVNEDYSADFSIKFLEDILQQQDKIRNLEINLQKNLKIKKIKTLHNDFFPTKNYNKIMSFSSLISSLHGDDKKWHFDKFDEGMEIMQSSNYPKGSLVGTMIHEILEKFNFTDLNSLAPLIDNCFEKYYFEQPDFKEFTRQKIATLTQKDILNDLSLAKVKNTLRELEFYLRIDNQNLIDAITEEKEIYIQSKRLLKNLKIDSDTQFLTGIIDFVFEFENRYFIIDWKTNDLGENYSQENLTKEMIHNHYVLQSHLYSLALDKYLSLHIKDYNYEKNFGGVFYIFLRGINNENRDGIFFDKIPYSFIEKN